MGRDRSNLMYRTMESVTVLFTQLAFIFPFLLFDPIFQFLILVSEFVEQFFVHLQNTSKLTCLSH